MDRERKGQKRREREEETEDVGETQRKKRSLWEFMNSGVYGAVTHRMCVRIRTGVLSWDSRG